MGTKKTIRFDYFQVCCQQYDAENNSVSYPIFDLEPILEKASAIPIADRRYEFYDEWARLQVANKQVVPIKNDSGTKKVVVPIWELQFLRIRKNIIPGIATDEGDFTPLVLDDNQGLGEEASALYDRRNSVLMLQRNRNSLSPSGIEYYFKQVYPAENIVLHPIILPKDLERFKESDIYKGFHIKFADIRQEDSDSSLGEIVSTAEEFDAVNYEVKFSAGRKKAKSLNPSAVIRAIRRFYNNTNLDKFEIKKKDDEDSSPELIDLIKERLHDFSTFEIPKDKRRFEHEVIFPTMKKLYFKRRKKLMSLLRG